MCEGGGGQRAVLWEAAVDGSLDFLHMQPEGQQCCLSQAFSTIRSHPFRDRRAIATTQILLLILGELSLSNSVSLAHSGTEIMEP